MNLTPFHGPPAAPPAVPGFVARTLLGFGAHGEVWLADDLTTGAQVALKVGHLAEVSSSTAPAGVPPPAGASIGTERETALLCRIDHPHIVRLQRVVPFGESRLALVLDLAAGGSLASLVAARGTFDPGEVTTLLIPLAGALGHLHRQGVVHGDIAPGNVLFAGDGRPQLGDLGVARVLGARISENWATPGFTDPALTSSNYPPDDQAADLWGLAAVAWFALTGHPPGSDPVTGSAARTRAPALAELLQHCLNPDPAARPGLDELADRAWQAARPVPIRLLTDQPVAESAAGLPPLTQRITRPVPSPVTPSSAPAERRIGAPAEVSGGAGGKPSSLRRPGGGQRLRTRVVVVLVSLAVGLACATEVAVRSRGSAAAPPPGSASGSGQASPTGPTRAATGLDAELALALARIGRSRAAAFAGPTTSTLTAADQPGSPAYRADLALVQRLRALGYRLRGVRYELRGVHVLHRRGDSVDVAATITTSEHQQVTSRTSVSVPVDGPRSLIFTVIPLGPASTGPARWRVHSVRVAS